MTLARRSAAWWAALTGVAVAVVAGVLVVMTGAPASAHASLLETDPENGSVVATLPDQIVLTFNEPIRLDSDAVRGFGPDGADWPVTAESQDNRVVVTPSGDPGTGTVVLTWKVISEDGHEVDGSLSFSIGAPSAGAAAGAADPEPTMSVQIVRWLAAIVALAGLVGAVACVVTGRDPTWFDTAWCIGFAAAVLLPPVQQLAEDGRGLGGLTDWLAWLDGMTTTSWLLLLAAYVVVGLLRARRGPVRIALLVVPAVVLAAGAVLTWPELPDRSADADAAAPAPLAARADLGTTGTVTIRVDGRAGSPVTLDLRLRDAEGRPLRPYAPPAVVVRADDVSLGDAQVEKAGPGRYRATVTIPRPGEWTAQVSVRVDEFDNPVAEVRFTVP